MEVAILTTSCCKNKAFWVTVAILTTIDFTDFL